MASAERACIVSAASQIASSQELSHSPAYSDPVLERLALSLCPPWHVAPAAGSWRSPCSAYFCRRPKLPEAARQSGYAFAVLGFGVWGVQPMLGVRTWVSLERVPHGTTTVCSTHSDCRPPNPPKSPQQPIPTRLCP